MTNFRAWKPVDSLLSTLIFSSAVLFVTKTKRALALALLTVLTGHGQTAPDANTNAKLPPAEITQFQRKARDFHDKGQIHLRTGSYAEAVADFTNALSLLDTAGCGETADAALIMADLGAAYMLWNRPQDSERWTRRALAIDEAQLGTARITGTLYRNLAQVLRDQRKFAEAKRAALRAIQISEKEPSEAYPRAAALNTLGTIQRAIGTYRDSEQSHLRAVAILEGVLPSSADWLPPLVIDLAGIQVTRKKYEEAEKNSRRALDALEAKLGPLHPTVANALLTLGQALAGERRYSEAELAFRRAGDILKQTMGPASMDYAFVLSQYANVLRLEKHTAEATRMEALARSIFAALPPSRTIDAEQPSGRRIRRQPIGPELPLYR